MLCFAGVQQHMRAAAGEVAMMGHAQPPVIQHPLSQHRVRALSCSPLCLQFPLPVPTAALEPEAAAGGIKAEPGLAAQPGAAAGPGAPAAAGTAAAAAAGTQQLMSAAASHPA